MSSLSILRQTCRHSRSIRHVVPTPFLTTSSVTARIGAQRWQSSSTIPSLTSSSEPAPPSSSSPPTSKLTRTIYTGPLTKTFKYLKLFSLSSLALSTSLSPFIFILDAPLPLSGRIFLAGIAISTTTLSTVLISYFTSPYVTTIKAHPTGLIPSHTITTTSMFLKERNTKIISTEVLEGSDVPMTTWKLIDSVKRFDGAAAEEQVGAAGSALEGTQEGTVLAWTEDHKGARIGVWTVGLGGKCIMDGKVVKYFNVHPELLAQSMNVSSSSPVSDPA